MRQICSLSSLEILWVDNTMITDAGLPALEMIKQLRELDLSGCRITDAGLDHIANITNLKTLVLNGTQVTQKGIMVLQSQLPACDIQVSPSSTTNTRTPK